MSERIAEAFWTAVLLVCVFSADQVSRAQQDTYSKEEKDTYSPEEKKICTDHPALSTSYYEPNGERHFVPYVVIDGQAVVEGDIVIGAAADLPKEGASYAPIVPARGRWPRTKNGVAPYVVPYVIDDSVSTGGGKAGSSVPDQVYLIQQAMKKWAGATSIGFQKLVGPRDWKRQNYVKFVSNTNSTSE
jgi:hypothetical protein